MMKTDIINGSLSISYPDSFYPANPDELKASFASQDYWSVWDRENHVIITVLYNRSNGLASFVADTNSIRDGLERRYRKTARDYQTVEKFAVSVNGTKGSGLKYSYTAENQKQFCNVLCFKVDKYVYSVSFFYRDSETFDKTCQDIMNSISFK